VAPWRAASDHPTRLKFANHWFAGLDAAASVRALLPHDALARPRRLSTCSQGRPRLAAALRGICAVPVLEKKSARGGTRRTRTGWAVAGAGAAGSQQGHAARQNASGPLLESRGPSKERQPRRKGALRMMRIDSLRGRTAFRVFFHAGILFIRFLQVPRVKACRHAIPQALVPHRRRAGRDQAKFKGAGRAVAGSRVMLAKPMGTIDTGKYVQHLRPGQLTKRHRWPGTLEGMARLAQWPQKPLRDAQRATVG